MIYKAKAAAADRGRSPVELGVEEERYALTLNGRTHALEGSKVGARPLEGL